MYVGIKISGELEHELKRRVHMGLGKSQVVKQALYEHFKLGSRTHKKGEDNEERVNN